MDLIDKKHVAFFEAGQKPGQLARLFNHRAARILDVHRHGVSNDVRQRRFAQARRTAEQDMLEHITAFSRGFHQQFQPLANFHLAGELAEHRRSQRYLESGVGLWRFHDIDLADFVEEAVSFPSRLVGTLTASPTVWRYPFIPNFSL